jgi:hypothetical protein
MKATKWTQFWDMHSGGGLKEKPYSKIYIEAPMAEAVVIFYNRFGHNPNRVTCTCCGEDYSIEESDSLEQLTGYHRGCEHDDSSGLYLEERSTKKYTPEYLTVEQYSKLPDILVIRDADIKPEEREGTLPAQGYVWVG